MREPISTLRQSSMRETDLMDRIRLECSTGDTRLWRNNVGLAYARDGRPVRFGLHPGSPDLIGLRTIMVTPDMVGRRLAAFVGIEVKAAHGRLSADQVRFLGFLQAAGAMAGIARSEEDAHAIIHP